MASDTSNHNPDSQCSECCELITELHTSLMPLLAKLTEISGSFDKEKLESLMNSPMLKLLGKFGG